MLPRAYYNEIDPDAVAALEFLIADGVIMPGDVDSRSIKDVKPDDLKGYTQCHFFAGGGLWSVAARLAGWPDDRELWTGSCPCQGESVAGKRLGADDPRHLWPDFYRIIRERRPAIVVGEQVAAAAGTHWLDGVCVDLENENYAARAVDIPACSVDAPHERNRLYWLAAADAESLVSGREQSQWRSEGRTADWQSHEISAMAHANSGRREGRELRGPSAGAGAYQQRPHGQFGRPNGGCGVAHAHVSKFHAQPSAGQQPFVEQNARTIAGHSDDDGNLVDANGERLEVRPITKDQRRNLWDERSSALAANAGTIRNGSWWADGEWIICHDRKARRAKPGIPMLVNGLVGRVAVWRLAGNAISPVLAAEVLAAFLEDEAEQHFRLSLSSGVFA